MNSQKDEVLKRATLQGPANMKFNHQELSKPPSKSREDVGGSLGFFP